MFRPPLYWSGPEGSGTGKGGLGAPWMRLMSPSRIVRRVFSRQKRAWRSMKTLRRGDGIRAAAAALVVLLSSGPAAGAPCDALFHRGDTNQDGKLDVGDAIATLGYLFIGTGEPGCLDAADADDSGVIELSDAVYSVSHLFLGGPALPPPGLDACGPDPTADDLPCAVHAACPIAILVGCGEEGCCPEGFYCEKPVGECDGTGACVERPVICPRLFDPWCGCDGLTYTNRCAAAAAGVNVVHRGPCVPQGGCSSNDDCPFGSFCEKVDGDCEGFGTCEVRPDGCIKIFRPVCGCDGATYSNDCEAAASGVNVAHPGQCDQPICFSNEECPLESYCARPEGACEGPGTCLERPQGCLEIFDPVCGCDGITYGNECEAGFAGMSVAYRGECLPAGECKSSEDCPRGSYCAKAEGECKGLGFCKGRPLDCEPDAEPVCGCDGLTYENECIAAIVGVSTAHRGPCDGRGCSENENCGKGLYCAKADEDCSGIGTCTEVPEACPDGEPVCGCDGVTYENACQAAASGMNVFRTGICEDLPRCSGNKECPDGYCARREGNCDGDGLCQPLPVECDEELFDPVCGCDGITYHNSCVAARAGTSVLRHGECDVVIGCRDHFECGGGAYCSRSVGDCDALGSCAARPVNCPDVVDPVCGCDGLTYDSDCRAASAGVNVIHTGPCEAE